jgi:hypothetical protein
MTKSFQLRSQFEMHGAFWSPNDPANTFTGRLARTKDGIRFTSSPVLKEVGRRFASVGEQETFNFLHGFTTEGACTVYYLQSPLPLGLTDLQSGQSLTFREYRVGLCAFGLHLPDFDTPFIGSVTFSYTGLHEWITLHPRISRTDREIVLTHGTDLPPIFDLSSRAIESRIKLEIIPHLEHRAGGEYDSRHESQLLVEPAEPRSLDWYLRVGYRFEHVFSLLLGTSVVLKSVAINHEEKTGWLVRKTSHKAEKPDPAVWVRCDRLQLIQAVLSWLDAPAEFRSLESLIYGTIRQSSLFVETEFLSLAQAIESFHRLTDRSTVADSDFFRRVLDELQPAIARFCENNELANRLNDSIQHANEPSFKVRIQRLLARLPQDNRKNLVGDEIEFEKTLRHTRNHFTHPGIEKKSKVLTSPKDIFLLNQKLHALLRLLILMHIGLPADQVFKPVFQQAIKWH